MALSKIFYTPELELSKASIASFYVVFIDLYAIYKIKFLFIALIKQFI